MIEISGRYVISGYTWDTCMNRAGLVATIVNSLLGDYAEQGGDMENFSVKIRREKKQRFMETTRVVELKGSRISNVGG